VLAPSEAVIVTLCGAVTDAAVAANVIEAKVAGTVTEAGTDSTVALLEASATVLPPVGAGRLKVTLHVANAPGATLTGAHASDETVGLGVTVIVTVVLPPSEAVKVTVWEVLTVPAVAVNVADVAALGTVIEAGAGSALLLSEASVTAMPPTGAGCVKVTVHVVEAPEITLVGAQESADTEGLGVTSTVAVVVPPSVAVSVTVCGVGTEPAVAENVVELALLGTVTDP
jgi:hypothetical protein